MNDGTHSGGHHGGSHHGGSHHGVQGDQSATGFAHGGRRGRRSVPLALRIFLSLAFGIAVAIGSVYLGQLLHH